MEKDTAHKQPEVIKEGHDINIVAPADKKEDSKEKDPAKDDVSDFDESTES